MPGTDLKAPASSGQTGDGGQGRSGADRLIPPALVWLWLCLITTPLLRSSPLPGVSNPLDDSWQMCNNYFLLHHLQAGVEFIFPTTLLGAFYGTLCTPALFWPYWLWQIGLASLLTANLWSLAERYPRRSARLALLLCAGFLLQMSVDAAHYVLLISCAALLFYPASIPPYRHWLNLTAMVLLSQEKFSSLVIACEILLVGVAFGMVQGRAEFRRWIQATLTFCAIWLALWLLLGQQIRNIPAFLRNLLAVTVGYNNTMGIPGDRIGLIINAAGALSLVLLVGAMLCARRPPGPRGAHAGATLLLLLLLFQIWKHGFVRNDSHAGIFFSVTPVLALLIPVYHGAYRAQARWYAPVAVLIALLSLANPHAVNYAHRPISTALPFWLAHPVRSLSLVLMPWRARQRLETQYAEMQRAWALPEVRRAVGDNPVDLLMVEQEAALLNSLRLRPRPVYQSYTAYTPALAELNADYYRGPDAPPFVLAQILTVNGHLPMQEDNRAWLELFRRYHPVLAERALLLLARNDRPVARETQPRPDTSARWVRLGEEVYVPTDAPFHLLAIRPRGTLRQKLQGILLRPGNLYLVVRDDAGRTTRYPLILDTAPMGFLLDPLITETRDLVRLYSGQSLPHVRSFHLDTQRGGNFVWPMEVTLTGITHPVGQPINTRVASNMLASPHWVAPQNPRSVVQSWGD